MQRSVDTSEILKTSTFGPTCSTVLSRQVGPKALFLLFHKVLSWGCFSFPIRSLLRVRATRWFGQPPAQEWQVEAVWAMNVTPHRQGSQYEPLQGHPAGFVSGVSLGGQEQRHNARWSAVPFLVLSCRHHFITDDGASPWGAATVCLWCDVLPTATAPSLDSREGHGDWDWCFLLLQTSNLALGTNPSALHLEGLREPLLLPLT